MSRHRASAAIWLCLFAVYCLAITLPAAPGKQLTQIEAHRLLMVHSLVTDRDLDLNDEYNGGTNPWQAWGGIVGVQPEGRLTPNVATRPNPRRGGPRLFAPRGGFIEPTPIGTIAALAPAYWIGLHSPVGGRLATQIWCAALMAFAFALALQITKFLVPEPYSFWGVLAVGLSPPAVLGATNIGPTAPAAFLLAAAALAVLSVRINPTLGWVLRTALPCALLAWVWLPLAPVAFAIAAIGARWMRRRRRSIAGIVGLEIILVSSVTYTFVHDRLLGGPTPWGTGYSSSFPYGVSDALDVIGRAFTRPLQLLLQPAHSPLVWAPVLLMIGVAAWRLIAARRQRLARISLREESFEIVAAFLLVAIVVAVLPYAVLSPWPQINWLDGPGTATALPLAAVLVAWAWQRLPRVGTALGAVTVLITAVLIAAGVFFSSVGSTTILG